mgnify:CR=1 FL=1
MKNKYFQKQIFSKTSRELLDDLEQELTKEKLKFDEIGMFNAYTMYAISTSWGNIRIEVDSCFKVRSFALDGFYNVNTFKCVFDWKDIFFKRVYQQLRLRHLFKEKEAL